MIEQTKQVEVTVFKDWKPLELTQEEWREYKELNPIARGRYLEKMIEENFEKIRNVL